MHKSAANRTSPVLPWTAMSTMEEEHRSKLPLVVALVAIALIIAGWATYALVSRHIENQRMENQFTCAINGGHVINGVCKP